MRINAHPLRNLPVGTDPAVLSSNGMSVTGGAVVSLAERENLCPNPQCRVDGSGWSPHGSGTGSRVTDGGDEASTCFEVVNDGSGGGVRVYFGTAAGAPVPVKAGDHVAVVGSFEVVSSDQPVIRGKLQRHLRDVTTGASIGSGAWGGAEVNSPELVTAPAVSQWYRMAYVFVVPEGIPANTGIAAGIATDKVSGTAATVRFGRMLVAVNYGIDLSPADFFDGDSPGASWSGTENASTSKMPVAAWNPLLNGGAGGFDEGLQAVRVYIPKDAGTTHGHRLTIDVTPGEQLHWLTHLRTDDPGSVGQGGRLIVNFHRENGSYVDSIPGTNAVELGSTPAPLTIGGVVPAEAATARMGVIRHPSGIETNLLYSASQVSPHSIPRYSDERRQGWRLRDEGAYHLGAESIPFPNYTRRQLQIAGPHRELQLAGPY